MSSLKISVVGSLNADLVVRVKRRPSPGETVLGSDLRVLPGGKGANQAVAASRMGASVAMVGMVGNDPFGEMLLDSLRQQKVDVTHVLRSEGSSGTAQILLDDSGQNSIVVSPGANGRLAPDALAAASALLFDSDLILAQLEIPDPAISWLIGFCAARGKALLLNPAPARPLAPDLLQCVAILVPNESETELLTGLKADSLEEAGTAANRLHEKGVRQVIITMGERGALWSVPGRQQIVPAFRVNVADTTAAGDCFIGALAALSAGGEVTMEALRGASAAAAISVTRPGAQPSMPERCEVERFLQEAGENT